MIFQTVLSFTIGTITLLLKFWRRTKIVEPYIVITYLVMICNIYLQGLSLYYVQFSFRLFVATLNMVSHLRLYDPCLQWPSCRQYSLAYPCYPRSLWKHSYGPISFEFYSLIKPSKLNIKLITLSIAQIAVCCGTTPLDHKCRVSLVILDETKQTIVWHNFARVNLRSKKDFEIRKYKNWQKSPNFINYIKLDGTIC